MEWGRDNEANVYTHWFQPLGAYDLIFQVFALDLNSATQQRCQAWHDWTGSAACFCQYLPDVLTRCTTTSSPLARMASPTTSSTGRPWSRARLTALPIPMEDFVPPTLLEDTPLTIARKQSLIPPLLSSSEETLCTSPGDLLEGCVHTPLLRAEQALNKEGTRFLKNLGYEVGGVQSNIGLEQEFFLVPRDAFARRLDLQMTGRTVIGRQAVMAPYAESHDLIVCV
eukprot:747478-Hanusia_phi.AAC.2